MENIVTNNLLSSIRRKGQYDNANVSTYSCYYNCIFNVFFVPSFCNEKEKEAYNVRYHLRCVANAIYRLDNQNARDHFHRRAVDDMAVYLAVSGK